MSAIHPLRTLAPQLRVDWVFNPEQRRKSERPLHVARSDPTYIIWQPFTVTDWLMDIKDRQSVVLALPPVTLDWGLNFASCETKLALRYWQSRCGDREWPARMDLRPSGMAKFLPHVVLFEVDRLAGERCDYRVRLAGSHVEQVYGHISGKRLDEALPAAIAARWRAGLDVALEAKRPLRLCGRVGFENKTWLSGEILLAPLGDPGRPITMCFGVFVWSSKAQ